LIGLSDLLLEHLLIAQIGLESAENVLRAILYFVITIFVLVTVHEFGHFIAGRIFGMRVPVFSVGMGRRLFGFNKINGLTLGPLDPEAELKLENNTDYRLSMLPIGGYAKIEGMIDETQNEVLPEEIQPWEFRAKPWWQKSIVICAGVIMNTLLAWAILSGQFYFYGTEGPATTTVGYVSHGSISKSDGLRPGDRIVSVAGQPVSNWMEVENAALKQNFGKDFSLEFERDGHTYSALYRSDEMGSLKNIDKQFGLEPVGYAAPKLDSVIPDLAAAKAGLRKGDSILAVNGTAISTPDAFVDAISSHPLQPIAVEFLRNGNRMTATVTPDAKGIIGVFHSGDYLGRTVSVNYGLGASISEGWNGLWTVARLTVETIREIFSGKLAVQEALGGPVKIAQYASKSAAGGLETFLFFMATLSISLALINILPIPALDGGHLLIILIEAILGHELSQRFKLNFQKVGIAILLFLMVFMVINDIRTL